MFDRNKIPWCLSFFLLFLALAAILFSRAGRFWAILVEDHPRNILVKLLKNLSSSVRSLLKQKLHVNFYGKSAPLIVFEGLMNRGKNGWMTKRTEGNLDTLDWYLTLYQILTKSIVLLDKYELFKYFNIKVMTQKNSKCVMTQKTQSLFRESPWHG